jgi:hypothetical protein
MKQRIRFIVMVSVMAFSILACQVGGIPFSNNEVRGSGNVVEESREVRGITGVELATTGTLHIEVGEREALRVEAEDNLLEYIETRVRGRTLVIDIPNDFNLRATRPINYYLTVTDLDTIEISSSGDIEAPDLETERFSVAISSSGDLLMGDLTADTLTVDISSSGDMMMGTLHAKTLRVDISSSGNLDVAGGEVEEQDITISSSGDYTARELESDEAKVRISSNGSATIRVSDYLEANLSSSGDLYYIGSPTVDVRTSSSGDVRRISE